MLFKENLPLKFRVSLGIKNMTLEELSNMKNNDKIVLDTLINDSISVCIDDFIVAKGEIVIIDGLFGIQICELCNIKINKKHSIQMDFVFGEFEIGLQDYKTNFEKGSLFSLNKDLTNNINYISINDTIIDGYVCAISYDEDSHFNIFIHSKEDALKFKDTNLLHQIPFYNNNNNIDFLSKIVTLNIKEIQFILDKERPIIQAYIIKYLTSAQKDELMPISDGKNSYKEAFELLNTSNLLLNEEDILNMLNKVF